MRAKLLILLLFFYSFGGSQIITSVDYTTGYMFHGDGTNTYLRFPSQIMSSDAWTFAVRLNSVTAAANNILVMGTTGNEGLYITSATHLLRYRNTAGTLYSIGSGYNLDNGAPHTVLARCDGSGNIYAYIDGVYRGTINTGGLLKVRYLFTHNSLTPKCKADGYDVRIWSTDVGDTQALLYHNNTMTSVPDIAWLPLSEGYGSAAYDICGTGNDCVYFGTGAQSLQHLNRLHYTYGFTRVRHLGYTIEVPYNINGTHNYTPGLLNAAEYVKEFPHKLFINNDYVTYDVWHIYIVGGQSNASGFRTTATMADSLKGNMGYIKIWNGTDLSFLNTDGANNNQYPVSSRLAGYGVDVNLWYLFNKIRHRTIVIKYAVNSTSLAVSWGAGTTGNTALLINEIQSCIAYLNAQNINYVWGGFVWYQGEADMQVDAYANAYAANLNTLITNIRANTTSNLHAYIFNPNPSTMGYTYQLVVNNTITNYGLGDPNSTIIPVVGVSNDLHPDATKMVILANTLYNSIH